MTLKIELKKEDSGDYCISIPSLPGCAGHGRSEVEALNKAECAVLRHYGIEGIHSTLHSSGSTPPV